MRSSRPPPSTSPARSAGSRSRRRRPPTSARDLMDDLGADEVEQDILSDLGATEPPATVMVGAEGLGGPSWQEPGSVEVGADLDRRGPNAGERDVPAAFLTGVVLAGVALAALLIGEGVFAVVAAAVVLVAQGELFGVMVKHHRQPATAVGLVAGALMMARRVLPRRERGARDVRARCDGHVPVVHDGPGGASQGRRSCNIGLTVLNMAWIPLLASYLLVMLEARATAQPLVVAVIGLTFVFDTAAFLVGSVVGRSVLPAPARAERQPEEVDRGRLIGARSSRWSSSVALVTVVRRAVREPDASSALLLGARGGGRRDASATSRSRWSSATSASRTWAAILPGPRRGPRPDRLAAVRRAGRVPAVPRDLRLTRSGSGLVPATVARGTLERMKSVTILGSTGSIGTQALDVVRRNPERFKVVGLSAAGDEPGAARRADPRVPAAGGRDRRRGRGRRRQAEARRRCKGVELIVGPDAAERLAARRPRPTWSLNALVGSAGLGAHARHAAEREDPRAREQGEPRRRRRARDGPDQGRARAAAARRLRARGARDGAARRAPRGPQAGRAHRLGRPVPRLDAQRARDARR